MLRGVSAACWLGLIGNLTPQAAHAVDAAFELRLLDAAAPNVTVSAVTGGSLDAEFKPVAYLKSRPPATDFWVKLDPREHSESRGIPVVVMHAVRQAYAEVYAAHGGAVESLPRAAQLPAFRGTEDSVFAQVEGAAAGQSLYAHVHVDEADSTSVGFSRSTLDRTLARGAEHARMIALAFGALVAMSLSALLIWFVLSDSIFLLYGILFFLQALYVAYLSGQGVRLALAVVRPAPDFLRLECAGGPERRGSVLVHARNRRPAALFTSNLFHVRLVRGRIRVHHHCEPRQIPGARPVGEYSRKSHFSHGVDIHPGGGVSGVAARKSGRRLVSDCLGLAGRLHHHRCSAFLFTGSEDTNPLLYYYGLPLSMVAAAVLIALGVADRLRAQRLALSDAERRAQTDPLTGVLNRRSLIERLDAACLRARARDLPIALLFIDLDHFKQINDSFGHQAGDACFARHHRSHSCGIAPVGCHRPLWGRRIRRDFEQRRCCRSEPHCAAHSRAGGGRACGRLW